MRTFFLLDIDCFFASVEMALNPALRGTPLCVGGPRGARGIVTCPNYEARKYGVRTAMPIRTAERLLPPDAVFMRGNHTLYGTYSENVMKILRDFTPDVEQVSVDEAYMDVTGCLHFWEHDPRRMALAMKEKIRQEYGLSVSIGVAANRTCAKIAAGWKKPDGLVIVPPGTERDFLAPLPVEAIPGVGAKTLPKLHACGIRSVGEAMAYAERNGAPDSRRSAQNIPYPDASDRQPSLPSALPGRKGEGMRERAPLLSLCSHIARCALPSDEPMVAHEHVEHSISRDRTFGQDTRDMTMILSTLYCLTERCCKTLRQDALTASTVTLRVRFADFTTVQKQSTLPAPSSNEEDIFAAARRMLPLLLPRNVVIRLVGVKVSNLAGAVGQQLNLDVIPSTKFSTLHERLDTLQARYGYASIRWGITCGVAERREEHQ